ncbi:MAG: type II toxin-antitoxin system RelE/ParE family toxin [Bacilli bacterium]|nr:type II toxin-antitoxin system RelE/ParE family toxin [Bacilli bacterium]
MMTKKNKIFIENTARRDINSIYSFYEFNYGKTYSKKYMKTFKNKINILCEFPYIGVLTDYDTTIDVDIRKIIVGRYSVYYMFLEESNKVIIIRIIEQKLNQFDDNEIA